jgi:hypothetical protein
MAESNAMLWESIQEKPDQILARAQADLASWNTARTTAHGDSRFDTGRQQTAAVIWQKPRAVWIK